MLKEEKVFIKGDITLEGLIHKGEVSKKGAILCHPHPLYGGDMYNNVIQTLSKVFAKKGFTTLRFNFRGVGKSEGHYGKGTGEVEDVKTAYDYLLKIIGEGDLVIAGYSFGAYVASLFAKSMKEKTFDLLLISCPVSFYRWDHLKDYEGRKILIGGEYDEIVPKSELLHLFNELSEPKSLFFVKTDHFYFGKEDEIAKLVDKVF